MQKKFIIRTAILFILFACFALLLQQQSHALDAETDINNIINSAEQGDAKAQYDLGALYLSGRGVKQDDAEAAKWFRKAAEQGDAKAQFNFGVMYYEGRGVPQDDAEAVKWFHKAAEQGHAPAQSSLGAMYALGRGVPKDYAEACSWFDLALKAGYTDASEARDCACKEVDTKCVDTHMKIQP